jgi:hypothetical protein
MNEGMVVLLSSGCAEWTVFHFPKFIANPKNGFDAHAFGFSNKVIA